MKKTIILAALMATTFGFSQKNERTSDSTKTQTVQINSAQKILNNNLNKGVTVGGYGQIDYNQPEGDNGVMDVHRMVLLFGYKFNDKVQFVTEVEMEHVKEIFVEQAFLTYNLNNNVNLRGGLMLVPMGLINEYHEPTTFNGVERPGVDHDIVPTTWREVGFGVAGKVDDASLKYQAYVFNGFKSDGLRGKDGLRKGRQKGAESTVSTPTFSAKVDYYGIRGLRLGLSGYFGKTQADDAIEDIDGATVGVRMIGVDARYNYKKFMARTQYITTSLSDTKAYNTLNSSNLGSQLNGWYVEGAYNLLPTTNDKKLYAFARYADWDTHAKVAGTLVKNDSFHRTVITTGLSFHIANGAVVKADYQFKNTAVSGSDTKGQLNLGLGVWF